MSTLTIGDRIEVAARITRVNVLGIGTEIVECLRIARMIERHGELFLNRVFTPQEIRYCQSRKQSTQHYAACWAAKEAVFRALGLPRNAGLSWLDLDIRAGQDQRMSVGLRGAMRDAVLERGAREILVTTAFCRGYATATALAIADGTAMDESE